MKSNIAIFFGLIAIATAVLLLFPAPPFVKYIFAFFWVGTGLLAFYTALKK